MEWDRLPINSKFEKARRKEVYSRLASAVRRRSSGRLEDLDDLKKKIRLFEQTYQGIRPIPVKAIVGTAGRSADFDKNFLPRRPDVRERWMKIEQTFTAGAFPPIVVYQVGSAYFVEDGHHRVAIAKQRGVEMIDAEITLLKPTFELPEDADIGRMILAEQEALFRELSGLDRGLPGATIDCSRAGSYVELLEMIRAFGYDISLQAEGLVEPPEAARRWYEELYVPTVEAIREEGLSEVLDGTEGDLFLHVHRRRQALFPERGSMSMRDAARETRAEASPKKKT